jgi:glycine/D-amino acid oxidase-like deaminating enzyme
MQLGAGLTDAQIGSALARARPVPYWLDQPATPPPEAMPPLAGRTNAQLAVIGGGFTGLWTALQAKEADPGRDVVLLEARRVAWAGTGRNGGFCSASLTHGLSNGQDRFPGELATLERLGRRNLDEIEKAIARYGIDCDFARTGELAVATQPWQADGLRETARLAAGLGGSPRLLDAHAVRAEVNSPTYLAGLWDADGCATLDPARLAWGLRRACLDAGVRIYEHTPVRSVTDAASPVGGITLITPTGQVSAGHIAMATGAFAPLLRRLRYYLLPVYDYVLMPGRRVVGTCRHFAVLSCALLRFRGIAARARCGFGTYFQPGQGQDHWITEYWHQQNARWVRVDTQHLEGTFVAHPEDLQPGEFLSGGEAWAAYREGQIDARQFGVFGTDNWGPAEIRGNAIRDLAALNKTEMLPWDEWGRNGGLLSGRDRARLRRAHRRDRGDLRGRRRIGNRGLLCASRAPGADRPDRLTIVAVRDHEATLGWSVSRMAGSGGAPDSRSSSIRPPSTLSAIRSARRSSFASRIASKQMSSAPVKLRPATRAT